MVFDIPSDTKKARLVVQSKKKMTISAFLVAQWY